MSQLVFKTSSGRITLSVAGSIPALSDPSAFGFENMQLLTKGLWVYAGFHAALNAVVGILTVFVGHEIVVRLVRTP